MSIRTEIDPVLGPLLIEAGIQAYYAYDVHDPAQCSTTGVTVPAGYELVDCWTGVDTVFGLYDQVECFGVVFRSQAPPYTYVFAFRGTYSMLDVVEDAAFWQQDAFTPVDGGSVGDAKVASGFWSIYTTSLRSAASMQSQLFALLDTYQASAQPVDRLLLTGHSLGAALSELFTLDVALSPYQHIPCLNYNFAGPRVGNPAFAALYGERASPTLRVQNTYDIVPCAPPELFGYQHVGDAYLLAFYNADSGWLDPYAKFYDHQALNYQAVLACAFASPDGACINDALDVPTDAETLVSLRPDPTTVCSFWAL